MLNPNILTRQDLKELKKLEKAREFDEERKARIFNARQRLIGVDLEALAKQVEEKKQRDELEKAERNALYMKEKHDIEIVNNFQRQIELKKKELLHEIDEFRKKYQKKEDGREFDLNDPDGLKKCLPCRLSDDDPRLSISSVQIFEGEDSAATERKRIKTEQQKQWLLQQMGERRKQKELKEQSDKILLETIMARDARAMALDNLERKSQRQIELATVAYNQALAYEQAMEERIREEMNIENNQTEINNALTSDLLSENTGVAESNLGLDKKIGAMYKGMSQQEKMKILETQAAQREELRGRREAERVEDKYWEDYSTSLNNNIYRADLMMAAKRREQVKLLYEENDRLAKEQAAMREYRNKVLYTNKPTADFYNQFNKTTR